MKGRCFGCGATSHVKKECPVRKPGDGNGGFGKDAKKTAKLKSGRDPPVNEGVKGGGAVVVEKEPITKPEPATPFLLRQVWVHWRKRWTKASEFVFGVPRILLQI